MTVNKNQKSPGDPSKENQTPLNGILANAQLYGITWQIWQKKFLVESKRMDFNIVSDVIRRLSLETVSLVPLSAQIEKSLPHLLMDWTFSQWIRKQGLENFPLKHNTHGGFGNQSGFFKAEAKKPRENFKKMYEGIIFENTLEDLTSREFCYHLLC